MAFFRKRKKDCAEQSSTALSVQSPPELTTRDPEVRRWARTQLGGGDELAEVETELQGLRVDPTLTEAEVVLAVASTKREAFTVGPALMLSLVASIIAGVSLFLSAFANAGDLAPWQFSFRISVAGILFIIIAAAVIYAYRALQGAGTPAAVQAVVEDRRSRGVLHCLPD